MKINLRPRTWVLFPPAHMGVLLLAAAMLGGFFEIVTWRSILALWFASVMGYAFGRGELKIEQRERRAKKAKRAKVKKAKREAEARHEEE